MAKILTSKGPIDITLPVGKSGEYYIICPICTSGRKSEHKKETKLSVNLDGQMDNEANPMKWRCHHCGEGGYVHSDNSYERKPIRPLLQFPKPVQFGDEALTWIKKNRGLSATTVNELGITISQESILQFKHPNPEMKGKWMASQAINFRYFYKGELINIKFRDVRKNFKLIKDAIKIFYNLDSIKNSDWAVITEGEFDVGAFHESGIKPVVSVPNGVSLSDKEKKAFEASGKTSVFSELSMEYLDICIDEFDHLKTIYIATDDDVPGIKLREELARRLGKHRCKFIRFSEFGENAKGNPINDPNELLIEKGPEVLANTLNHAYEFPIHGVTTAMDHWDEIDRIYDNGQERGISTGFKSLDAHFNWMKGWTVAVNGYPSEGKALNINTDIPTPKGFVKMKDIKTGDIVYDEKGKQCNVTNSTEIMYNRPCYEITFSDHTKIECDEEHLWFVHDREARTSRARHLKKKPRTKNTTGIDQQHLMRQPKVVNTKYIFDNQKSKDLGKSNFSIDNTLPVQNEKLRLAINPYILGLWLGDGSSSASVVYMDDKDALDLIPKINLLGHRFRKRNDKFSYHVANLHFHLKDLNLLKNKHIPKRYFNSSIDQRLELLRGIMDSDGTVLENGHLELSLSDEKLARDAHALISSLGIKSGFIRNKSFLNKEHKKDRFRMNFITDMKVFKLERKLKRLRPEINISNKYRTITSCRKIESVPVKCIQVDSENRLYLASRSYIPTHNSSAVFNLMAISSVLYGFKWGVYSPENYPVLNLVDTLAEILLDNTTNKEYSSTMNPRITKHELKIVTREHIDKHFFFIDNEDGYTPEELRLIKTELIKKKGITGFFTDPWSALTHDLKTNPREDIYLRNELNAETRLSTSNNIINLISHHPPTPDNKNKPLQAPSPFSMIGGQIWFNKVYAILCVHKINREDPSDTRTGIHVQKIKEHKLAGLPTKKDTPVMLEYKRKSGRLLERERVSDPNSAYTVFPFKKWEIKDNTLFDDF